MLVKNCVVETCFMVSVFLQPCYIWFDNLVQCRAMRVILLWTILLFGIILVRGSRDQFFNTSTLIPGKFTFIWIYSSNEVLEILFKTFIVIEIKIKSAFLPSLIVKREKKVPMLLFNTKILMNYNLYKI